MARVRQPMSSLARALAASKSNSSQSSISQTCLRQLRLPRTSVPHAKARSFTSSRATREQQPTQRSIEGARAVHRMGPFSLYSAVFFLLCAGGLYYYFTSEKERLTRKRIREQSKGYGKPRIGGPFSLTDQYGRTFTAEDMKGKFALVYFGFSHCPDICPDELDKMARMLDMIRAKRGNVLKPVIITCDPARDSPEVLKKYLAEFHPDMIGLTGSWEDIKATCKAYRVYFSTPPYVKPGQDYLVDHSIYFYLMDPEGDFIEVVGRQHTAEQGAKLITDHIDKSIGRQITPDSWKEEKITDLEKDGKGFFGGRKVNYKPNLEE